MCSNLFKKKYLLSDLILHQDDNDPSYAKGFGFDDKTIRAGFIRRVYSILSVS